MYGIFHNTSVIGIIVSVILVFIVFVYKVFKGKARYVCLLLGFSLVVLLLLSRSRSGWLGFIVASFYYFPKFDLGNKYYINRRLIFIALLLVSASLFLFKIDSSIGRIHIYCISLCIFSDNLLTGVGIGKFKAIFNEYQASFFSKNDIDSKRALLADNTFYAFNDYLQWAAETGIIGIIIFGIAFFYLVRRIQFFKRVYPDKPIIIATTASLLCLAATALFSYPLQTLPGQFLGLMLVGVIIFYPLASRKEVRIWRIFTLLIRFLYVSVSAYFLINSFCFIKSKISEKKAYQLELSGFKTQAMEEYKTLSHYCPSHGHNTFKYAELLYYMNQLNEARITFGIAQKSYIDNRVYKLKAKIENELGNLEEAEKYYLRAIYMVPNRMGSRYDLLNFYLNQRDTAKAVYWANSILHMPVKVQSERTERMLRQTKKILQGIKLNAD